MKRWRLIAWGAAAVAAVPAPTAAVASPGRAQAAGECGGVAPVVCHYDVPPGAYDVSVVLGSPDVPGSTAVRAEARRMMLAETVTEAGRFARGVFSVDVREPEGEPTLDTLGTPGLTLTFTGAAPQVGEVTVRPARQVGEVTVRPVPQVGEVTVRPARQVSGVTAQPAARLAPRRGPRLFLAGDSTVCDQGVAPYTGWGQAIPQHLRRGVTVANYADSGESTGSFLADPRLWGSMVPRVGRGDVVLLQFGHNDKTTTAGDYRANLIRMITELRAVHAKPVLVSPPVRRVFDATGRLTPVARHVNGLGVDLPAEMEAVATGLDVPYVDLTADSAALIESLGAEGSKPLYLYDEKRDNTHFSEYGADQIGRLVLDRLRELRVLPAVRFRV